MSGWYDAEWGDYYPGDEASVPEPAYEAPPVGDTPVAWASEPEPYVENSPATPASIPAGYLDEVGPIPTGAALWKKNMFGVPIMPEAVRSAHVASSPGDVGAVEGVLAATGGAGLAAKGASLMAGPGGKVGATLDIIQGISGLFGQVQQSGLLGAVGVGQASAAPTMEDALVNVGGAGLKQGLMGTRALARQTGGRASRFVSIGRKGYVGQVLSDGSVRVRRAYRPVVMSKAVPSKAKWKRINKQLHDWRSVAIGIINRTGGMNKRSRGGRRFYSRRRK